MALFVRFYIFTFKRGIIPKSFRPNYFSSHRKKDREYKECCNVLEIPETSSNEQIRQAYLHLAKKYHPDSPEGNLQKFQEVDEAFRKLVQKNVRKDEEGNYEIPEEFDIKHTAPQHRQYLSNEGVGSGTPFQREKQYRQVRIMNAANNVLQHRIGKVMSDENTLMDKNVPVKHKIKTQYGFDRLVEDLIQESMSKGEFSNLSGSGKPLKSHSDVNPYVDFVTHKINQVLIDNGFTPEWITLQKEIRDDIEKFREKLAVERSNYSSSPLSEKELLEWKEALKKFLEDVKNINRKIDKFNLVVPILNKQMVQIQLQREADVALASEPLERRIKQKRTSQEYRNNSANNQSEIKNIFGLFETYFKSNS